MKNAIALTLLLCLAGCKDPQADALRAEVASLEADNADLVRQLDAADKRADAADAKAKGADSLVSELSGEVAGNSTEAGTLKQQLATAATEKQQLAAQLASVTAERDAAVKDARATAQALLKAERNSCPPPEVVPKETLKQEFAPAFTRADGKKTWQTDFDWDESKAKELGRLQFIAFGTRSCPHCDWFLTQCSDQAVGADVFRSFVPCWITVQDAKTHTLADRFGVNEFRYPAAMLRDATTGKYEMWRPSKDNATLQREIADHAKALK